MEVKLDKRYPLGATLGQAWTVLGDLRAVAACMPGAQITEQLDETHFKGTVKSKIGPAVMNFGGDVQLQGVDAQAMSLSLRAQGADKAGSSATMQLTAHLEKGDLPGTTVLVGRATVVVSGKLAQFGSRLLVPVSDALLQQFAGNFQAAALAVPLTAPADSTLGETTEMRMIQGGEAPGALVPRSAQAAPPPAAPVKELNALALMWTVLKNWLAGLFGRKG